MLAENIERWKQEFKQEGIKEGFKQGIEQGIEQARQKLLYILERLLQNSDQILSEELKAKLSCASLNEIQLVIDKILNEHLLKA